MDVAKKVNPMYRPLFHYTSEAGWINDPNGFSRYKGVYHLFAQHNPYDTKWGPMHWSHAISHDLITWEHQPIALVPEKDYEMDLGCFSGTAIEHEGKHILMYTGCKGQQGGRLQQEQCIAIGDGINYEKLPQNPVIGAKDLPNFVITHDFRDPKIFKREDMFYCLLGAQVVGENIGTMLLYKSQDLISWEYVGETLRAPKDGSMGIVFECPDFFRIGDKDVILTSPIEMPRQGYRYNNISSAIYFVGEMNFETGAFTVEYYDEIDGGFDFYAPQTLEDDNGDRILIAWAQMWHRNFVTDQLGHGWAGSMSLPRKLSLKDKRLYQEPIGALKNYHEEKTNKVEEGSQDLYHLEVKIDVESGNYFELDLLKTSSGSFKIIYDKEASKLMIDRSQSLFKLDRHKAEAGINNCRWIELKAIKNVKLDIVVDKSIVEVFINDGQYTMTSNYYIGNGEVSSCMNTNYKTSINKWNLRHKSI